MLEKERLESVLCWLLVVDRRFEVAGGVGEVSGRDDAASFEGVHSSVLFGRDGLGETHVVAVLTVPRSDVSSSPTAEMEVRRVRRRARCARDWFDDATTDDATRMDTAREALVARHRRAELDEAHEAYDRHSLDEADEWGDMTFFHAANLLHGQEMRTGSLESNS